MSFLPKAAGTLAGGVIGGQMFGGASPVGALTGGVIGGGMADKLLGTGKKPAVDDPASWGTYRPQGSTPAIRSGRGSSSLSV